jgi:hypothetical protein
MSSVDTAVTSKSSRPFFLARLFNGDYGLAKTFWIYAVCLSLLFKLLIVLAAVYLHSRPIALALMVPYYPYRVIALSGAWHAADKYDGRDAWAVLAKVAVVIGWLFVASELMDLYQMLFYPAV